MAPPTINIEDLDPEIDLDIVAQATRRADGTDGRRWPRSTTPSASAGTTWRSPFTEYV